MFEYPELPLSNFQLVKTPLPPKIIQLRRISQENYVRRMKTAHLRKEQSVPSNLSSSSSTSTPKSHSNNFRAPFIRTTYPNNIHPHKSGTESSVSAESSFNCFTPNVKVERKENCNSDTKLVHKKCQCIWEGPEDRGMCITGAGDFQRKIQPRKQSSGIGSNASSPAKSSNENSTSSFKTDEKSRSESGKVIVTPDSTKKIEGRKSSERISSCEESTFIESPVRGVLHERTCWSTIALTRLSAKEGCKIESSSEKYDQNNADETNKYSPSVSKTDEEKHFKTGKNTITPNSTKPKDDDIETLEISLDGHQTEKSEKRFSNSEIPTKGTAGEGRKNSKQFNSCEKTKVFESPVTHVLHERICGSTSNIPIALPKLSLNEGSGKALPSSEEHRKFQKNANINSISSSQEKKSNRSSCIPLRSETKTTSVNCEKSSETFSPVISFFSTEKSLDNGDRGFPVENKVSIDVCSGSNTSMTGDANHVNKINCDKDERPVCDKEIHAASSYQSIPQSSSKSEAITENSHQNNRGFECEGVDKRNDTEEVENGEFNDDNSYGDRREWRELLNNDDKSKVTVPSNKDLDLQEHWETKFRGFRGYLNTPYYLRHPRYAINVDESVTRSDAKETDAFRQMRIKYHKKKQQLFAYME